MNPHITKTKVLAANLFGYECWRSMLKTLNIGHYEVVNTKLCSLALPIDKYFLDSLPVQKKCLHVMESIDFPGVVCFRMPVN